MSIQAKKQNPWFIILILAAGVVLWALDQRRKAEPQTPPSPRQRTESASRPAAPEKDRSGNYEVYRNCRLAADKTNDGDSFRVLLPDGRREIFRLYFVDTPESAFKTYANGENNHDRIREQARDMELTPDEAVETGKRAKSYTLGLLERQSFTLHTNWDSPFHDQRYHAFVEVQNEGRRRWLHELLLEKGFARLKTKPADLPDGTPAAEHRRKLQALMKTRPLPAGRGN